MYIYLFFGMKQRKQTSNYSLFQLIIISVSHIYFMTFSPPTDHEDVTLLCTPVHEVILSCK